MPKFRFSTRFAHCAIIMLLLASLAGAGYSIVENQKATELNEMAFAAWLSENNRYRLFNEMSDAMEAWRFSVHMTKKVINAQRDRENYEAFLRKWSIPKKPQTEI